MSNLFPKPPAGFLFFVGYLLLMTSGVGMWIVYLAMEQ